MKKKILSFILVFAFCAALFPASVFAAGHITVNNPGTVEATAGSIAGGATGIDLAAIFTDSESHSMTFSETNHDGNSSPGQHISNGHYYFTASSAGTYHPAVQATCSDGSKAVCTFTIDVVTPEDGLPVQYNYEETPAAQVTVYVTISSDGVPLMGNDADQTPLACLPVTIPYFDLAIQEMQDCYRFGTDNGRGDYSTDEVVERPTAMHLFIYMVGVYYLGLDPADIISGDVLIPGHAGTNEEVYNIYGEVAYTSKCDALYYTGSSCSTYMQYFWGHDENLMYYRNHAYPLMSPGWGATSDYMLLSDGDTIDLAMFSDWGFYTHGAFLTFGNGRSTTPVLGYNAEVGETFNIQTLKFGTQSVVDGGVDDFLQMGEGVSVLVCDEDWLPLDMMEQDDSIFSYVFEEPGTYYLLGIDDNCSTEDACYAPAVATITVTAPVEDPEIIYGDASGDGLVTAFDASLVLKYAGGTSVELDMDAADVNGDGVVSAFDASLILKYAGGQITEFPVQ